MVKKAKELSALAVGRLIAPGHYAVGGVAGLYLFVSGESARSWVLRVMIGKKRRHVRSELFYGTQASPWQCPNKFGIVLGLCYL